MHTLALITFLKASKLISFNWIKSNSISEKELRIALKYLQE
jgi:hypothetical protein